MKKFFKEKAAKKARAAQDQARIAEQDHKQAKLELAGRGAEEKKFLEQSAAEAATTKEYTDWVEQYLKKGGCISAVYPQGMKNEVLIVRQDGFLPPLYSGGLHVIVPEGVNITTPSSEYAAFKGFGHSKLYMRDGSVRSGTGSYVVLYGDTVTELKSRGHSLEDLKNRYSGPEWNEAGDMKALKDAFSGAAEVKPDIVRAAAPVTESALPVLPPELHDAIKGLKKRAPTP